MKEFNILTSNNSEDFSLLTIRQVIEQAQRIDVGLSKSELLRQNVKEQNGITGLLAWSLVADKLAAHAEVLAPEVSSFLIEIKDVIKDATSLLPSQDAVASGARLDSKDLKNLINSKLMSKEGSFPEKGVSDDVSEQIRKIISEYSDIISSEGQLVYQPFGRKFSIIVEINESNTELWSALYAAMASSNPELCKETEPFIRQLISKHTGLKVVHVTLNEDMSKKDGEGIFNKLNAEIGTKEKSPLHIIVEGKDEMVAVAAPPIGVKLTKFYSGLPQNNSRMYSIGITDVELDKDSAMFLEANGLASSKIPRHITISEQVREPNKASDAALEKAQGDETDRVLAVFGGLEVLSAAPVSWVGKVKAEVKGAGAGLGIQ